MSDILLPAHIGAIVWLVSGLVLCAAETMAPGAFLIWVGLAASLVGAIAYFVTVDFTSQLLLFGILVAGLVLLGRRVYGSLDASPGPLPQGKCAGSFHRDAPAWMKSCGTRRSFR
jgi:inner membrane protein